MGETRMKHGNNRFQNIQETFRISYIFARIGLIWPNPERDTVRYILIGLNTIFLASCIWIIGNDARHRLLNSDSPNLIRQLIILIAVTNIKFKIYLSVIQSKLLRNIIDIMNEDYAQFNDLSEEHQVLVENNIKKTKKIQHSWAIMVGATTASYILVAIGLTIYSQLFSDNPRKYMIHECRLIFLEEGEQYSTPFFELFFMYCILIIFYSFVGFVAYDNICIMSILHISVRLQIISLNLLHLLRDVNDIEGIKKRIIEFVKDHCEIQKFTAKIEKCFQWWLIMLFFNAILQIGMCLSQSIKKEKSEYQIMYYLFFMAVSLHAYFLCYVTSELTQNAGEIANVAYNTSWEDIQDVGVKKSIALIIARAQKPTYFKAMGMLTINMELLTKILRISYSIFTILRK